MDYRSGASLQDRVAIITGAAGGIGFEASKALQDHGAIVVLTNIDADRGKIAAEELGVEFFQADLTAPCRFAGSPSMFSNAAVESILPLTTPASRTRFLLKNAPMRSGTK